MMRLCCAYYGRMLQSDGEMKLEFFPIAAVSLSDNLNVEVKTDKKADEETSVYSCQCKHRDRVGFRMYSDLTVEGKAE